MRTIMARTPHDSSVSFSKRHFQWITKKPGPGGKAESRPEEEKHGEEEEEAQGFAAAAGDTVDVGSFNAPTKKKHPGAAAAVAMSRFRAAFMSAIASGRLHRGGAGNGLGTRVTGTLYGRRRGHVHFAFQGNPRSSPVLLIELATPTSGLVREMASGSSASPLSARRSPTAPPRGASLRSLCGGPSATGRRGIMYMRARFERVVGSRDSEAFYMMNPDGNGGPELSIYLLRV
ncbi:unnamed protein product [Spirodela intermedia]|uniref:Uncharacterized protein n=1 Tax=Spirodela intermedia TaxID=51605 RepID=A0A7I8J6Y7_SPIIN|nr:unnamed protein product [Spirodela intermedia]CAA6665485.1 unnamed protein product [Spirodela intermedia]